MRMKQSLSRQIATGKPGPPDSPRESTLVPVPVAQFEQMEDTDDPAP